MRFRIAFFVCKIRIFSYILFVIKTKKLSNMESPFTWFADAFGATIYQCIMYSGGVYERLRNHPAYPTKSPFAHKTIFVEAWKQHIPMHQFRQFELRSKDVRQEYYLFLVREFTLWLDMHMEQYLASGISPWSFFCLHTGIFFICSWCLFN